MKDFFKALNEFFKFDLISSIFTGTYFKNMNNDERDDFEDFFFLSDRTAIIISQK